MKFNIKVTREHTFLKRFRRKSSVQRIQYEFEQLATEHEKLAEHARRISQMLDELVTSK